MPDTERHTKTQKSIRDLLNDFFTGEPVAVGVEEVSCTTDEYHTHEMEHLSDFEPVDLYLPLLLIALVFGLKYKGWDLLALGVQIFLLRDLLRRLKRRPSGKIVTGFHLPTQSGMWKRAFLIYFACLPAILTAIWLNRRLMENVFQQPTLRDRMLESRGEGVMFLFFTPTTFLIACLLAIVLEFFMTVVFAPLTEELWFRGIGLAGLMKKDSVIRAVLITSVIFGVLHGPGRMIFATVFGLVMALIRFRTGSLYCCMVVHGVHNFGAIVYAIYSVIREFQKFQQL